MQLFSVYAKIDFDDNEFNSGINAAEGRGKSFASKLGGAMAKGALAIKGALVGIGAGALAVGNQYDQSMSIIQSRTKMTDADISELSMSFRDMGLDGIFSANQIASAYSKVAATGQDTAHAIGVMEMSMRYAQATGADLGKATNFLNMALMKTQSDVAEAERYINLFTQTTALSTMGVGNLQKAVVAIAPTMNASNDSMEAVTATLAQLYQGGIYGIGAARGLEQSFNNLVSPTNAAQQAMEYLKFSMFDYEGNVKSLTEALPELMTMLDGVTDTQTRLNLQNELFSTVYSRQVFDELSRNREAWKSTIDVMYETSLATGEASIAYQMAADSTLSFNQALGMIQNSGADMLKTVWEIIKAPFAETLGAAATKARDLAERLRAGGDLRPIVEQLGNAISTLANTVVSLATRAIEPTIRALSFFANALTTVLNIVARFPAQIALVTSGLFAYSKIVKLSAGNSVLGKFIIAINKKIAATKLSTAVTAKLTKATTAAAVVQAGFSAQLGVTKVALVAAKIKMAALNAVMKANPIGLVVAGVAALVAGITALVSVLNRETEASKVVRDETKKLVQARNQNADAADRVTSAVRSSAEAHNDRVSSMEAEIGVSRRLIDRIEELSGVENKSAAQKADLAKYVSLLNENMGETVAKIDGETGALQTNISTIRRRIDALADEAKAQVQRERMVELAREQMELEAERDRQLRRSNDLTVERVAIQGRINEINADGVRNTREQNIEIRALNERLDELNYGIDESRAAWYDLNGQLSDSREAFDNLADTIVAGYYDMANAAEDFADTIEYQAAKSIGELTAKGIAHAAVLEDLAAEYERVRDRATDAFNTMSMDTSKNIKQITNSLLANAEITRDWGENYAYAMDRVRGYVGHMGEEVLAHLSELANRGPGYAYMLRDASETELIRLAEAYGEAADSASHNMSSRFDLDTSVINAIQGMVGGIGTTLHSAMKDAGFDAAGFEAVQALAGAIDDETATAALAAEGLGEKTIAALKKAWNWHNPPQAFVDAGKAVPTAMADGIDDMADLAITSSTNLGTDISSAMKDALEYADFFGKGANAMGSLDSGMLSKESTLMATAQRIADGISSTISNAFEEGSPMKVFVRMGEKIPDSLGIGIDRNTDSALSSARNMADKIINMADVLGNYAIARPQPQMAMAGATSHTYITNINGDGYSPHEIVQKQRTMMEMSRWLED